MPTDPMTRSKRIQRRRAKGHETLCAKCGKPERAHCSLDEPGVDHEWDCPLMHHEFKAASPGPVPA